MNVLALDARRCRIPPLHFKISFDNQPQRAQEGRDMRRILRGSQLCFIIWSLIVAGLIPQRVAAASSWGLQPIVDCVTDNGDGTFTATFGYDLQSYYGANSSYNLPVGENNSFSPDLADRGQPTLFNRGRHAAVFKVTWDGTPITWTLKYYYDGSFRTSSITASGEEAQYNKCGIIPIPECIVRFYNRDEQSGKWGYSMRAYFSYYNLLAETTVPKGDDNFVEAQYLDVPQSQPEVFQSGSHSGVFAVKTARYNSDYQDVYWRVRTRDSGGNVISDKTAWADWEGTRECSTYPIAECIKKGCEIENERGDYTAYFGYENLESFAVTHETPDEFNHLYPRDGCEYDNYSGGGFDRLGNKCNYPQPTVLEPGKHRRVFAACFGGSYSGGGTADAQDGYGYGYVGWQLGSNWYENYSWRYAELSSMSKLCNRAPLCDAGAFYGPACSGAATNVFLKSGSTDPDGDALSLLWTSDCADGVLSGDTDKNPVLTLSQPGIGMSQKCKMTLNVKEMETDEAFESTCTADIAVNSCVDCSKGEPPAGGVCIEGTSSTGCETSDLSVARFQLGESNRRYNRSIKNIIRKIRRTTGDKNFGKPSMTRGDRTARLNAALILNLPSTVQQCNESKYCSSVSLSSKLTGVKSKFKSLYNLSSRLARRMRRAGMVRSSNRYSKNIRLFHKNVAGLLKSMPETYSKCS